MSDFSDLYQDLILDHQKNPRNFGVLAYLEGLGLDDDRVPQGQEGDRSGTSLS